MLIECILHRAGGTEVVFGTGRKAAKYHFKPDDEGRHVCEVTDEAHIVEFLKIPEGYEEVGAERVEVEPPAPPVEAALPDTPLVDMSEDELRAYAIAKYARTFHPNAKSATIIAEIQNLGG